MSDRLDELLAAVRAESGVADLDWAGLPEPLTGGFWAEMWRVRLAGAPSGLDGDLVARVMPPGAVAARETVVQRHLADAGYPTPVVRLAGAPGQHLDRAWMVMDHATGSSLLGDLSGVAALARAPRLVRGLPDALAGHAAALHRLDPTALAALLGADDETDSIVDGLERQATEADRRDLVAIVDAVRALRPRGGRTVVCHGDLHPFNVLHDPSGDTVLDWSAARLTDPAYDLAYTSLLLGHPPLVAPTPVRQVVGAIGRSLVRRLMHTYDRVADAPVDPVQLDWFGLVMALRVLVEMASWTNQGTLDERRSHPFHLLAPHAVARLERATGRAVRVE
jgi:aminoglycoside phosphotransferase (APT) family kinase protein